MNKVTITENEYWEKVSELVNEAKCKDKEINGFILSTIVFICGKLSDKLFDEEEKEEKKRWN